MVRAPGALKRAKTLEMVLGRVAGWPSDAMSSWLQI